MEFEQALRVAVDVADYLRPYCERLSVAGSIRRGVREVKDIEIVCIPRWEDRQLEGVMFDFPNKVNLLHDAVAQSTVIRWIKPGASDVISWPIKPDGKYWRGLIHPGCFGSSDYIKLDLFIARPENWGVIYAIRTGSADFSRALVTYARDRTDYRVAEGMLVYKGAPVPCPEEEVLFDSLSLLWVDPPSRRGAGDVAVRD